MDQNKSLHPKTVLRLPPGATLVPAQQSSAPPKASSKSRLPSASMATLTMTPKAKKPIPNNGTYTVQKGDSLWKISRLFGVSVKNLQTYNGLNSTSLGRRDNRCPCAQVDSLRDAPRPPLSSLRVSRSRLGRRPDSSQLLLSGSLSATPVRKAHHPQGLAAR